MEVNFHELNNDALPGLLIDACFELGVCEGTSYTRVAFLLACVSKEFQRAADEHAETWLGRLQSIYSQWLRARVEWQDTTRQWRANGTAEEEEACRAATLLDKEATERQRLLLEHTFGIEGAAAMQAHINTTRCNKLRTREVCARELEMLPYIDFSWSRDLFCFLATSRCMLCAGANERCLCETSDGPRVPRIGRLSYSGATLTHFLQCVKRHTIRVELKNTRLAPYWTDGRRADAVFPGDLSHRTSAIRDGLFHPKDPVAEAVDLSMCLAHHSLGRSSLDSNEVIDRISPLDTDEFWDGPRDADFMRASLFIFDNRFAAKGDCLSNRLNPTLSSEEIGCVEEKTRRVIAARKRAGESVRAAEQQALFDVAKQRVLPVDARREEECRSILSRSDLLCQSLRTVAMHETSLTLGWSVQGLRREDVVLEKILESKTLASVQRAFERVAACVQLERTWQQTGRLLRTASVSAVEWALGLSSAYLERVRNTCGLLDGTLSDLNNHLRPGLGGFQEGEWPSFADVYEVTAMHVFDAVLRGDVKVTFAYERVCADPDGAGDAAKWRSCRKYVQSTMYTSSCAATASENDRLHLVAKLVRKDDDVDAAYALLWAKVRGAVSYEPQRRRWEDALAKRDDESHYTRTVHECTHRLRRESELEEDAIVEMDETMCAYTAFIRDASKDADSLSAAMHAVGLVWEHVVCALDTAWLQRDATAADAPSTRGEFCRRLLHRMGSAAAEEPTDAPLGDPGDEPFCGDVKAYLDRAYSHVVGGNRPP